ncbi:MAG: hypothetical protein F2803_05440 [Actinobacteria bacterium]|nr:hypothetical protein [Actinomycetota bacterium]
MDVLRTTATVVITEVAELNVELVGVSCALTWREPWFVGFQAHVAVNVG